MKISRTIGLSIGIVILIIFNLLFFLLESPRDLTAVWVCYGFIHLAAMLFCLLTTFPTELPADDRAVQGALSFWYLLYVLISGIVLIIFASHLLWLTLLMQLIPAGVFTILLLVTISVRKKKQADGNTNQIAIGFIRNAVVVLQSISDQFDDKTMKREIKTMIDVVKSSPNKSDPQVANLERQFDAKLSVLADDIVDIRQEHLSEHLKAMRQFINERNSKLRMLN
jgi:hypothetical protein